MQSSIYLTIALAAFTAAKQLNVGPQVFSERQSSSLSSQNPEKRYITQEYTFYLTPEEIKALQTIQNYEKTENTENNQSTKERQPEQQNEEEQQLKWYSRQFLSEAPQLEIRGIAAHDSFFQKQKSDSEIQQGNYKYNNFYLEDKPREQNRETQSFPDISKKNLENYYNWQKEQEEKTQQESDLQSDAKWKPYLTESAKNQDQRLNEQLKQQWNRILDHNRQQLTSVSPAPEQIKQQWNRILDHNRQQLTSVSPAPEQIKQQWNRILDNNRQQLTSVSPAPEQIKQQWNRILDHNGQQLTSVSPAPEQIKQQWNRILDHNRQQLTSVSPAPEPQETKQRENSAEQQNLNYEIKKEIENILRDHRAYENSQQSGNRQADTINQKLPILIHKEVSVTKHLPVTVVKNVKVPVPKPVLVPVPEPYEVKIPHPYPVPLHILQQIPVPYIRNQ